MALVIDINLDLDTADADGLATNQDSNGTSIVLDGALISGGTWTAADGIAKKISITDSDTDTQTDVTFTINGTNQDGITIADTITGPGSGATVVSTKYFKTVTSVTVSAAQGGTEKVDIGTSDAASTATLPINFYNHEAATIQTDVTGTINFTVQETMSDVTTTNGTSALWAAISALTTKTADTTAQASLHANGLRTIINSYSAGAEIRTRIIQGRD